jgi:hypothetical protein
MLISSTIFCQDFLNVGQHFLFLDFFKKILEMLQHFFRQHFLDVVPTFFRQHFLKSCR